MARARKPKKAKKTRSRKPVVAAPVVPAAVVVPAIIGRPCEYSQATADIICGRMAEGESVRTICRDPDMPAISTVMRWRNHVKAFSEQYARAREMLLDVRAEELIEIADDGTNDWMEKHNSDGKCIGYVENGEALRRSALRVDTRKWELSKLLPKRYGDKLELGVGITKTVRLVNLTGVKIGGGNSE